MFTSIEQEPDALVLGGFGDVGLAQLAGEFIEHLQEARHEEAAERALAIVGHFAVLHGDEDDAPEEAGRAVTGDPETFRTLYRRHLLI